MSKVKRMLRPADFWRIGEHESWFSDMAKEGLHLKSVGIQFFKFTKGEPKNTKYRIDLSQGEKIAADQKEIYAQSGWDYVTSYGAFNVFASPVALNAPELHTDPAEQAYTLDNLSKNTTKIAMIVTIAVSLMIILLTSVWLLNPAPYLALIDGSIMQQAIIILIELYVAYSMIQAAISIRSLRKTLSEGRPIDHATPWRRQYKVKKIIASLFIILAIFGAILPFKQMAMRDTKTLPIEGTDLPIVRLADIEQNPDLKREISSNARDNIIWGNRYQYDWSLFAPIQYESEESCVVSNKMWKDESGVYSPSLTTRVYQLHFPSSADNLVTALAERYGLAFEGGDFVEIEHAGFDTLIVHEVDDFKEVFASKGKAVMYVRYYGYANTEAVIGATADKIALISD